MEKPILDYDFNEQEVPYGDAVEIKEILDKETLTEYLKKEGYNDCLVNDAQFRKVMANTVKFRLFEIYEAKIRLVNRILDVFSIK